MENTMKELHPSFSKYAITDFPHFPFQLARRNRASTYSKMPRTSVKLYLALTLM